MFLKTKLTSCNAPVPYRAIIITTWTCVHIPLTDMNVPKYRLRQTGTWNRQQKHDYIHTIELIPHRCHILTYILYILLLCMETEWI